MPKIRIACKNCGKQKERYRSTIRNINLVFCSKECKGIYQKGKFCGSENPNYRHGNWVDNSRCPQCDRKKDCRSNLCSICSKKSFPREKENTVYQIDINELKKFIKTVDNYSAVAKRFKRSRTFITKLIKEYKISTDHFIGQKTKKYILCKENKRKNGTIKKYIIQNNLLEYKCKCGIVNEWDGQKINLDLDHINGDPTDNRLENLRFLCPNCHSQTPTYKGRKKNV